MWRVRYTPVRFSGEPPTSAWRRDKSDRDKLLGHAFVRVVHSHLHGKFSSRHWIWYEISVRYDRVRYNMTSYLWCSFIVKMSKNNRVHLLSHEALHYYWYKLSQSQPCKREKEYGVTVMKTIALFKTRTRTFTSTSSTLSFKSLVANLLMRMSMVSLNWVTVSLAPMFTSGKMFR